MRLYLIRHGQTAWNAEGRAQGHTDIGLDEEGLLQARLLGAAFESVPLERVWSSDLLRARQTAEAIARSTGAGIELDPRLRERSFGDWEGQPYQIVAGQIHRLHSDSQDALDVCPPNGESVRHVWERLTPVTEALAAEEEDLAIVSHGGACALLLAQMLKGSMLTARSFRFGNTSVTELVKRPEGLFLMERYNDTSHLASPARAGDLDGTRA